MKVFKSAPVPKHHANFTILHLV